MTPVDVFSKDYGFNIGAGGLAYIGLGVGFVIASLFGAKFGSEVYRRVSMALWQLPLDSTFISLCFPACRQEWRSWKARDAHSSAMCWVPVCSRWTTVRTSLVRCIYIMDTFNFKCRWYGWSAEAKLHWMMPIVGTGIYGFGEFYADGTRRCSLIMVYLTH